MKWYKNPHRLAWNISSFEKYLWMGFWYSPFSILKILKARLLIVHIIYSWCMTKIVEINFILIVKRFDFPIIANVIWCYFARRQWICIKWQLLFLVYAFKLIAFSRRVNMDHPTEENRWLRIMVKFTFFWWSSIHTYP